MPHRLPKYFYPAISTAFLTLCLLVLAAGDMASAAETEKLSFVDTPYPPYVEGKEGGSATGGLAVNIVQSVFSRLNTKVEINLLPWKRALKMVETGRADGIALLMQTEERKKYLAFSQELFSATESLYYLPARLGDFKWQGFADLKPYRIGLVRGFTYGETFMKAIKEQGFTVEYAASTEQNLMKLMGGRVDLVLEEEMVAAQFIRQNPAWREAIARDAKPVTLYPYYMGLSKSSGAAQLMPRVDAIISDIRQDGTLAGILGRLP